VKDNDFGPPSESVAPTSVESKDGDVCDDIVDGEEPTSMRSDGDGSSSKGDAIIGSIRYVSCSVAGSDPFDNNPKENDEGKNQKSIPFCCCCCFIFHLFAALRFFLVRDVFRFVYVSCFFFFLPVCLPFPWGVSRTVFQPTLSKRMVSVEGIQL
jgi:hypothetical protein